MTDISEPDKSIMFFGRDITQIPCFRNSFLYGITGGIFTGFAAFMGTSRPQLSTHIGFGTFFSGTIIYWFYCRYNYSKKNFHNAQLREAMQKGTVYEGTALEKEMQQRELENNLKSA